MKKGETDLDFSQVKALVPIVKVFFHSTTAVNIHRYNSMHKIITVYMSYTWVHAEATWRCLRRKKSVWGPKLRQATQIPTQRTAPTLTLQHAEHIVQPDLASTAGRIAHASTQQTLLALQDSALDPSMRSQHRRGGGL